MGSLSIWHWLIVLAVIAILFGGGGKLSQIMGDLGKGLKAFKKNVKDEGASSSNNTLSSDDHTSPNSNDHNK